MARIIETIGDFDIEICYSLRSLARILGINHQKLKRTLDKEQIKPRNGKIWLSDLRDQTPHVYESILELLRQKQLGKKIFEREHHAKTLFEQEMELLQ